MKSLWRRQRQILTITGLTPGWSSHAQYPTVWKRSERCWRIFVSGRCPENRASTYYLDVDPTDDMRVLHVATETMLQPGSDCAIGEDGIGASQVFTIGDETWLYLAGLTVCGNMDYRIQIGRIRLDDDSGGPVDGARVQRVFASLEDGPAIRAMPFLLRDGDGYQMLFTGGVGWTGEADGFAEPHYVIQRTRSPDAVTWSDAAETAIGMEHDGESGLTRATCLRGGPGFEMWYCYRGFFRPRSQLTRAYRLGYAVSPDGNSWTRHDDAFSFINPPNPDDWDHEMQCHPFVVEGGQGKRYLFYSGNEYGRFGFGYASNETSSSETMQAP